VVWSTRAVARSTSAKSLGSLRAAGGGIGWNGISGPDTSGELAGLGELRVEGLPEAAARARWIRADRDA